MFLDIAHFTAWSSERHPVQVFQLLETVYGEFDRIAAKLGVFKVHRNGLTFFRCLSDAQIIIRRWKRSVIAIWQFVGSPNREATMQLSWLGLPSFA
jgi:class 3 adenylate cyclase